MAVTLTGFEYYSTTGLPVTNATVEYWPAVDGTPAGAATGSTTTDADGKWEFAGLADGKYDVKVTKDGRYRWYKGNTSFGIEGMRIDGALAISGALTGVTNLTASGTIAGSDVTASDDLIVTDDASIGGDLTVTGDIIASNTPRQISELSGAGASFDFTSLSLDGVYRFYELVGKVRSDDGTDTDVDVIIKFNNDSSAVYSFQKCLFGGSTTYNTGAAATSGKIAECPAGLAPAGHFGSFRITIFPNLTSGRVTWNGTFHSTDGTAAGDQFSGVASGFWDDTSDVTRITLTPGLGSWASGSWVALYGYP